MMSPIKKLTTMASSFTVCSLTHMHTHTHIGPCPSEEAVPLAVLSDRWLVTELNGRIFYCRLKEEENERWGMEKKREKLLHYTGEVNHSMCRRSQNGIYIYTHGHTGTCMNMIRPVSFCVAALALSLFHTFAKAHTCTRTHTHTHTHTDHQIPGMRKAERLDQCWAPVISFNWGKRVMGTKKHYDLFPVCTHRALIRHIHIISFRPESSNYIKSTFS